MPPYDAVLEQDEYRIVLLRSGSPAIWTIRNQGPVLLPRVAVLKWRRLPEQLQKMIENAWNIRATILDCLPSRWRSLPCAVAEIISSESPWLLTATDIDEISEEELSIEERKVIGTILADAGSSRGPFCRLGWIREAIEWLEPVINFVPLFALGFGIPVSCPTMEAWAKGFGRGIRAM